MMWTDELCVTFHIQNLSDSGGHYKLQNMLGLGKKKEFPILIDFHFILNQNRLLNPNQCCFQFMNEQ